MTAAGGEPADARRELLKRGLFVGSFPKLVQLASLLQSGDDPRRHWLGHQNLELAHA
jgi:hypothetical protein